MAIPVASFQFQDGDTLDRTVKFTDTSTGTPTSWDWDFGDGSPAGNEQNPEHTYAADGVYVVKLTSTNMEGSNTFQYSMVVVNGETALPSISQMVLIDTPDGVSISNDKVLVGKKAWMDILYLAEGLDFADRYKEAKYRPLTRLLIARLIVYDYIVGKAQIGLMNMGGSGTGGLKAIETGPARTEWYQESESWKTAISAGGQISLYTSSICLLAAQVGIYLPFCEVPNIVIPPKVISWNC